MDASLTRYDSDVEIRRIVASGGCAALALHFLAKLKLWDTNISSQFATFV